MFNPRFYRIRIEPGFSGRQLLRVGVTTQDVFKGLHPTTELYNNGLATLSYCCITPPIGLEPMT